MKELLPCPFCGGKAESYVHVGKKRKSFYIECIHCESSIFPHISKKRAIEVWNRRV